MIILANRITLSMHRDHLLYPKQPRYFVFAILGLKCIAAPLLNATLLSTHLHEPDCASRMRLRNNIQRSQNDPKSLSVLVLAQIIKVHIDPKYIRVCNLCPRLRQGWLFRLNKSPS